MRAFLSPVTAQSGIIQLNADDKRYGHVWVPESQTPWGVVGIVHGFGDHGGRFAGMATSLASTGLAVVAMDLVGHGQSPGKRGCIDSYEQLLDEIDALVTYMGELLPKCPNFLFGQSMGGNLVLNWALRRKQDQLRVRGIVCGSPMLRSPSMPKEKIMSAGRWLAGKLPNVRIPTPVQAERLSQDRRAQDAYLRDPWVHRSMSLRLAMNLIDSGLWAIEHAADLRIPALLMHGSEDTLTCPSASREFVERSCGMAQFRNWPGCRHDLHDEPQRERVFAFAHRWFKERCITTFRVTTPKSGISAAA